MKKATLLTAALAQAATAALLWDGRFNDLGPRQVVMKQSSWALPQPFSPDYKNPADAGSKQGGPGSRWTARRSGTARTCGGGDQPGEGVLPLQPDAGGARPASTRFCFFESHFAEMKYGWISGEQGWFMVEQGSRWKAEWAPDVWHNVAFEIDFGSNTVGFWHSEGADLLERAVAPVAAASTSSNGADWHLGVLELPRSGYSDDDDDDGGLLLLGRVHRGR
ncbi:hypothetical protein F4775DRAFT_587812 [Biscogniauxia sp. FL1348]|nr:hypothetical protein F4775DRAFT_587812 [Biscogniauxia sp. FL1348]